LPAELSFDAGDFALQASTVATPDIELCGTGYALVIGGHRFNAAAQHIEHSV
jgi:hypothetical protein